MIYNQIEKNYFTNVFFGHGFYNESLNCNLIRWFDFENNLFYNIAFDVVDDWRNKLTAAHVIKFDSVIE